MNKLDFSKPIEACQFVDGDYYPARLVLELRNNPLPYVIVVSMLNLEIVFQASVYMVLLLAEINMPISVMS